MMSVLQANWPVSCRGKETILLVDDEPVIREMAGEVLQSLGYRVLMAEDGSAALRAVAREPGRGIDLLLTDVVMPRMTGDELASSLLMTHQETRVLLTSGFHPSMRYLVAHNLMVPFLRKPYGSAALACAVRDALDETRRPAMPTGSRR